MGRRVVLCVAALLVVLSVSSRAEDRLFSLTVRGTYTTASRLFPNPDSQNPVERGQFVPIDDFFGYGLEVRYLLPETNLALGLGVEYISVAKPQEIPLSSSRSIPVEDGYRVIPIELTAYFLIPVSGPTFGVLMGGGGGAYLGRRMYSMAGVEAGTTDQGLGFGIHVLGGVIYRFNERFSLTGDMKFRDVQFTSTNAFSVPQVVYNGILVNVSQTPFDSQVHTDGIVFQLGATVSF
jgi:hypothetical protein